MVRLLRVFAGWQGGVPVVFLIRLEMEKFAGSKTNKEIVMFKLSFAASLIAGVFSVSALAADGVETQQQEQVREQGAARPQLQQREQFSERIYGSQLMTPAERLDYRNKMRNMKGARGFIDRDRWPLFPGL